MEIHTVSLEETYTYRIGQSFFISQANSFCRFMGKDLEPHEEGLSDRDMTGRVN